MALLTFKKTYDTKILIGDVEIPVHVQRLKKQELEALDEEWNTHCVLPRGSMPMPSDRHSPEFEAFAAAEAKRIEDWFAEHKQAQDALFARAIDYITLDADIIDDDGQSIRDGAGLVRIFHGRRDTLRDLTMLVLNENHLTGLFSKNSNSPRDSAGGSTTTPVPAHGGNRQEPTAESVANSGSASRADATGDRSSNDPDTPASSGARHDDEVKRIH